MSFTCEKDRGGTMRLLAALVLVHILCCPLLFAAFKDPGFLARPTGLGGAFVAVADDVTAGWFNPAGLAQLEGRGASFTYSKPYASLDGVDISLSCISYLHSLGERGTVSAGWARFSTADLYQEDTFLVSYGYDLSLLQAGASLKFFNRAVVMDERTAQDEVFSGGSSKSAFSVDLGAFKTWGETLTTGLCVKNVNEPNVGFLANDPVPSELWLGASDTFAVEKAAGDLMGTVALSFRNKVYNIHAGAELWLLNHTLAARAGGNRNEASVGSSYLYAIPNSSLTLETHYSFSWPFSIEGTAGSHRLSLGIQF